MKIIKRILYILSLLIVYELSKYVANEIITRRHSNISVTKYPRDYEVTK
ncbi:transcriptional activator RinB [Staphylococcus arlettae]